MIRLRFRVARVRRPLSPGQTRLIVGASDDNGMPVALFLCGVEPPDIFSRRMRESFHTICSVEDMAEYPAAVSCVREVDPQTAERGVLLYSVQENVVYVRDCDGNRNPVWRPYEPRPENLNPNVHSHKLPFFRRSTIDIVLPNRDFVDQAVGWIGQAVRQLEKDMLDLDHFKSYE